MDCHQQASGLMEQPLGTAMGAANWAELGFCALALGNLDQASTYFQKGLTTQTAMSYLARPALLIGSTFLSLNEGDVGAAGRFVQEAHDFVAERRMKYFYPMVALTEGQVSAARGGPDAALERFAEAERQAMEMGMRPVWYGRPVPRPAGCY